MGSAYRRLSAPLLVVSGVSVALTFAVLGPVLLTGGFVLVYDMVFTPSQPLLPASIGLGPALPRAVPADAVVGLITAVLPGDILQKSVLAGALLAGAFGVARLVPTQRTTTRVIAAVAYTWNAFVAERLFIGHWTVLVAYGLLPWIVLAGLTLRARPEGRDQATALARLVLVMLPAMIGPTSGLLAAGAAVASAGRRWLPATLGLSLLLNAPWWLPSVLHPQGGRSDPAGVAAFAARGESWGGPVLSVLGLGGIWNADVVPASRESAAIPVITVLVVGLALFGCWTLAARLGGRPVRALLLLGALGVLISVAGSVPLLDGGLRWSVEYLPGAGLLRDGQRFAAWWALPVALGFAVGAERLAGRLADPLGRRALLAGAVLLPVLALPDLAWAGLGRLQPVRYPADWATVAALIDRQHDAGQAGGDALVLPFMTYRAFAWNDHRTQLDPAPRLLPIIAVADDDLPVGGTASDVVHGEDSRVAAVRQALAERAPPAELAGLGIEWIVVEHGTPGDLPAWLAGLTPEYAGDWVSLYRINYPASRSVVNDGGPPALPVLLVDALVLVIALVAGSWLLAARWRKFSSSHRGIKRQPAGS